MARGGHQRAIQDGGFRRIAVLRLSSLGDVILTQPVLQALAAAFPEAHLTYWVKEEFADLVRHDPAVAHVRVLEREARRLEDLLSMSAELEDADLIVDLHGNLRTRILTMGHRARVLRSPSFRLRRAAQIYLRWARPPRPPTVLARHAAALAPLAIACPEVPRVHAGPEAETWAAAWLAAWGEGAPPVAMIPGAAHPTKRWPGAHWLALHERLRARGERLLYFGLEADRARLPDLAPRVAADPASRWCAERLARVAALLSHCRCAVAGDTGLMHLAAARGLKVVAMFGSTAPELGFAPAGLGHAVLCRHEPCQPCTLHGRERCPQGHFRCMVGLTPQAVADAAASLGREA